MTRDQAGWLQITGALDIIRNEGEDEYQAQGKDIEMGSSVLGRALDLAL